MHLPVNSIYGCVFIVFFIISPKIFLSITQVDIFSIFYPFGHYPFGVLIFDYQIFEYYPFGVLIFEY